MNKLVVLSLTVLLTGCFKIGPDYIRPQIDTPKKWRFSESNVRQNATHLKWWEQLGDPVLNQAVQGNLDLKIAVANVEQFMGQYGSTRANLFPQIFGAANYAHDQPGSSGGDILNSGTNSDEVDSEYQRRSAFIPLYEQQIAITENALSVLLGRNPGPIPRGLTLNELKLPAIPAGLPSDLLAQRPDIQQAEQELIAANARIGVARAQYFPKISLTGDVGQMSTEVATLFAPGANFWSVGSALLTPIFTAGKIAGFVQSAEAVQKAAVANYPRSILSGFREFENALVSSNKTKLQKESQSKRVAAVQNYFNLSRIRYDEGYTDYITVLDSIRQLFDAQIDLIQAQSANFTATIGLYRAMGGGWIIQEEKTANLPKPVDAVFFP